LLLSKPIEIVDEFDQDEDEVDQREDVWDDLGLNDFSIDIAVTTTSPTIQNATTSAPPVSSLPQTA
jgi:hypothetical protein